MLPNLTTHIRPVFPKTRVHKSLRILIPQVFKYTMIILIMVCLEFAIVIAVPPVSMISADLGAVG